LKDLGVRVWETRSLADCWDELADSPASFVVLELGGDLTELLGRMTAQLRTFPAARLAVVTDRRQAERQWLLREAGAVEFVSSPRQAARLAQLACRHLAQVPPPQLGLTERIWASLPWGKGV
jgi:DNA-binding response OmpR family regulator